MLDLERRGFGRASVSRDGLVAGRMISEPHLRSRGGGCFYSHRVVVVVLGGISLGSGAKWDEMRRCSPPLLKRLWRHCAKKRFHDLAGALLLLLFSFKTAGINPARLSCKRVLSSSFKTAMTSLKRDRSVEL